MDLTASQIVTLQDCLRRRRRDLERSVERAKASRAAGNTVQHGTLDSHLTRLAAIRDLEAALRDEAAALTRRVLASAVQPGDRASY